MEYTVLGRTGLRVSRTAFGVLPLQRTPLAEAAPILRKAYDNAINFYDTARAYTDSEEKIGAALSDVRDNIIIATKTGASDAAGLFAHLETSLRNLKTDYVDILQLHNPTKVARPDGPDSLYAGLTAARDKGMVRYIGITCHRLDVAREAAASGLYDTVQFPLSAISSPEDLQLINECEFYNVGLIAMKALCGGLLTHAPSAFAFLRQFPNVVPIWGMQHAHELDELLALEAQPPALDAAMWQIIEEARAALTADFCRACGYCLPCPASIPIPMAARMSLLLRRMPYQQFLTEDWRGKMEAIENCVDCGHCRDHCPYGLDTPSLLKKQLTDYREFSQAKAGAD